MFVSVTFNFDTYKEATKARTLEVGKKLRNMMPFLKNQS